MGYKKAKIPKRDYKYAPRDTAEVALLLPELKVLAAKARERLDNERTSAAYARYVRRIRWLIKLDKTYINLACEECGIDDPRVLETPNNGQLLCGNCRLLRRWD